MSQKIYIKDLINRMEVLKRDYLFEIIELNQLIHLYQRKMEEVGNVEIDTTVPNEWMM